MDSETDARLFIYNTIFQRPDSPREFVSAKGSQTSLFSAVDSESSLRRESMERRLARCDTASSFASDSGQSLLSTDADVGEREQMYANAGWSSPPGSPREFLFEPLFDLAAIG